MPCTIGELKNLKHLDVNYCDSLAGIPCGISQRTSLKKLGFFLLMVKVVLGVDEGESGMCSLKDFTNFPNLMELCISVKAGMTVDGKRSGIKVGPMGTWLEMKHLVLEFDRNDL